MSSMDSIPSASKSDLARQWYVPQEIQSLRTYYPVVIFVAFLSVGLSAMRGDNDAIYSSACIVLVHIVALLLLRQLDHGTKNIRDGIFAISGIGLFLSILHHLDGPGLWVDIWFTIWTTLPFLLVPVAGSMPMVTLWVSGRLTVKAAELGLRLNRVMADKHSHALHHLVLIHAVTIVALPLLWILDVAVSPGNALGGGFMDEVTGEHFEKLVSSESFWLWTRNSLIVSIGTTLLGLALAIPAGYAFSRFRFRGRDPAMFAFLLVQMFPGVIILVPYFLVMKALGLLNTSLGLILAYSVTALPLCVWMLKGFFDTVPRELEEAALVDGCSQTQVFWRIVLPLSLPAVAVTALFSFLAAWNEFLLALTFNTSEEMYTLPVGLASLISSTGQAWGDFAAASLLVSLPVVVLFIAFQRFLIEGLSAGGVKG